MPTYLVIGGNRGIGFALVQEIASKDSSAKIFATTRNPSDSPELQEFASKSDGKVIVVQLDMLREESVQAAVTLVTEHSKTLDHVFINAGIMLGFGPIFEVKSEDLLENMNGNVIGPHNIFKAFTPLVLESKSASRSISVTSSLLGSLGALPQWGPPTKKPFGFETIPVACYAVSKTAVNSLVCQWADYLTPKGIPVIAVHPGLVKTRMGELLKDAISPEESAHGYFKVVQGIDASKVGDGIYSYDGQVLPW